MSGYFIDCRITFDCVCWPSHIHGCYVCVSMQPGIIADYVSSEAPMIPALVVQFIFTYMYFVWTLLAGCSPSVLWCCWLGGRKDIWPVKTEWWDDHAGVVICLGWDADLHMAQLMPLPLTVSCSSKSRLVLPFWYWLTWVVPDKVQVVVKWL